MTQQVSIQWDTARWLFPMGAVAAVAAVAVVVFGRADLAVFAAPLVGAVARGWWSGEPGRQLSVNSELSSGRVFEGDTVTLRIDITPPTNVRIRHVHLDTPDSVEVTPLSWRVDAGVAHGQWQLRALRWGRAPVSLELQLSGSCGLRTTHANLQLPGPSTFPTAETLESVPRPTELPDRLGVHLGRRRGAGFEFAGIREYLPGDSQRSVNWRVSARRGRLHVNERLAEQSANVVVMIDASTDIRQPGGSTLELSVQGALGVVQAALRRGDRAGVVGLGGTVHSIAPNLGRKHLYRVLESLVDVEAGSATTVSDVTRFPRSMLPSGAAIVAFSPLLDARLIDTLADLRRRGFGLAMVDVLRIEPRPQPDNVYEASALRLWRVDRRGIRYRLGELGIPVTVWSEDVNLEAVLRPMSRRPLLGARR